MLVGQTEKLYRFTTIALYAEGILFACSTILGVFFILIVMLQMHVSDNMRFLAITVIGGSFFLFIIGFAMSVILIIVAVRVTREIKRILMPSAKMPESPPDTQPKWF